MNEDELLELCSDKSIEKFNDNVPYWSSEIYGFGRHIREYGYYPKNLPLLIFTEHSGPVVRHSFNYFETHHNSPVVFLHSPERVKEWRAMYKKPCYSMYSPFVFYRRRNNITQAKDAKGTLAYPVHTIPELDISNMEDYIFRLKNLPEKYQPVSVSLHYHDINKGLHKLFFKHGIAVYTAGTPFDYRFTQRFYSVLRNFKFTTSNFIGSYLFYAVELNIPFFLYGQPPEFTNNTNSKLAQVALEVAASKDEFTIHLTELFSTASDEVTPKQKQLVESTLGLHGGVSRLKMATILYSCYLTFYLKNRIAGMTKRINIIKTKLGTMFRIF